MVKSACGKKRRCKIFATVISFILPIWTSSPSTENPAGFPQDLIPWNPEKSLFKKKISLPFWTHSVKTSRRGLFCRTDRSSHSIYSNVRNESTSHPAIWNGTGAGCRSCMVLAIQIYRCLKFCRPRPKAGDILRLRTAGWTPNRRNSKGWMSCLNPTKPPGLMPKKIG